MAAYSWRQRVQYLTLPRESHSIRRFAQRRQAHTIAMEVANNNGFWLVDGSGKSRVQATKEVYPVTVDSMFQIPKQGNGRIFILPGQVQQGLSRTESDSVDGSPTFSSSLSDQVHGSAVLVRNLSSRKNQVATGSTGEDYVYSDSTGVCYNHSLYATQGYVTANTLSTTC